MRRYENVEISKLIPYENNAKVHPEEQVNQIANSIKEFGFINPVLIDNNYGIIAGHGRVLGATKLGMKEVPCLFVEDLTDEQKRAYIIADNKLTENGEWNFEILRSELTALDDLDFDISLTGFTLEDIKVEELEPEVEEDYFDIELPVEPKAKLGDIYQLGNHRLMCGDSTNVLNLEKLFDGKEINLVLTDPPYGIDVVQSGDKAFGKIGGGNIAKSNTYMKIKGDETTDTAKEFYNSCISMNINNYILFGGNYFTDFLEPKACWIVWDKQNTGNFADVELAWTSFDKGAKLYSWLWNGLCRKGDRKVEGLKRVHPTQKPVGLLGEILKDFSKENDNIFDGFGGSGSTLIACEQLNRNCYMIEYEPYYIDVIINRWEQYTGKKAVLLNE